MNITEQTMPYRRGRILALLKASNECGMSGPLLRTTLQGFGYKCDADTFAIDIDWLSRHGLLRSRDVGGIEMMTLTQRGRDVVTGNLEIPGVKLIED